MEISLLSWSFTITFPSTFIVRPARLFAPTAVLIFSNISSLVGGGGGVDVIIGGGGVNDDDVISGRGESLLETSGELCGDSKRFNGSFLFPRRFTETSPFLWSSLSRFFIAFNLLCLSALESCDTGLRLFMELEAELLPEIRCFGL
jgi:hypothetical protein